MALRFIRTRNLFRGQTRLAAPRQPPFWAVACRARGRPAGKTHVQAMPEDSRAVTGKADPKTSRMPRRSTLNPRVTGCVIKSKDRGTRPYMTKVAWRRNALRECKTRPAVCACAPRTSHLSRHSTSCERLSCSSPPLFYATLSPPRHATSQPSAPFRPRHSFPPASTCCPVPLPRGKSFETIGWLCVHSPGLHLLLCRR